jgi:uncharacterized phage protein (TIGR02220 family)
MKSTIAGFNQEFALTLKKTVEGKNGAEKTIKIDCTDLTILRWLVDFWPSMKKMNVDGKEYAWLTHKKLQEDIPLLDISKRACVERMQKLVEFKILDYKFLKQGGTFSLYAFGENYINLVRSTEYPAYGQPDTPCTFDQTPGAGSTIHPVYGQPDTPVCGQPDNKDISIIDKSIKDNALYIVGYLNEKNGTRYKPDSKETVKLIKARMKDGYQVADFITVIDNMCAKWKGDPKMEDFLRPSTLFGNNFENYLNAKPPRQLARTAARGSYPVGPNGIAYDPTMNDLDGQF